RIPEPVYKEDWYNRSGFFDQSQARATRQVPSIRVQHAGHAAQSILLPIRVSFRLTDFLHCMPMAALTNLKPEPRVRHLPSESTALATPPLYTAPQSFPSLVGCLPFPHAIGLQRDTGLAEARWFNMSAP
uniref:SARAH domain-containing protein n=1 Tax=Mesocestoides corti TaxID=53468 RepID=A0A5K3G1H0_MESCO